LSKGGIRQHLRGITSARCVLSQQITLNGIDGELCVDGRPRGRVHMIKEREQIADRVFAFEVVRYFFAKGLDVAFGQRALIIRDQNVVIAGRKVWRGLYDQ
jgi:hypothetical protein